MEVQEVTKKAIVCITNLNITSSTLVAIGCSGGVDSMVLSIIASKYCGLKIVCLIVDHKIRENSTEHAIGARDYLESIGIKCKILTLDLPKNKVITEEIAREYRYQVMFDYCIQNGINKLLLGHHADDQIETFFLRTERGSGLDGLCCMKDTSMRRFFIESARLENDCMKIYPAKRHDIEILRPFVNSIFKDEILEIAKNQGVVYFDDETNKDIKFKRNDIRMFISKFYNSKINKLRILQTILQLNHSARVINTQRDEVINRVCKKFVYLGVPFITIDVSCIIDMDKLIIQSVMINCMMGLEHDKYKPNYNQVISLINSLRKAHSLGQDFVTTLLKTKIIYHKGYCYIFVEKKFLPNITNKIEVFDLAFYLPKLDGGKKYCYVKDLQFDESCKVSFLKYPPRIEGETSQQIVCSEIQKDDIAWEDINKEGGVFEKKSQLTALLKSQLPPTLPNLIKNEVIERVVVGVLGYQNV